jgi:hypothetical protein
MKALILILLTTASLDAQSLADVARRERVRQDQVVSSRVIIMNSNGAVVATDDAKPANPAESAKPASAITAPAAPAPVDPAKKRAEDIAKLRLHIQQLQDQETALQLEINDITNQAFAPVTDANAQAAAHAKLSSSRERLVTVRQELASSKVMLQQLEAQQTGK